jgi:hypothetical protein
VDLCRRFEDAVDDVDDALQFRLVSVTAPRIAIVIREADDEDVRL